MAFHATTDSVTRGAVDQSAHTVSDTLFGSFYEAPSTPIEINFQYGPVTGIENSTTAASKNTPPDDQAFNQVVSTMPADDTVVYRALAKKFSPTQTVAGSFLSYKSYAVTATASTPTASGVTATTANLACNFFPNTLESTVVATLQYRVLGSGSAWTNVTTGGYTNNGYSQQTATGTASGLTASTTYEIRLVVTRTTENATSLTSASGTFTTGSGSSIPTISTTAATGVGVTAATLNGIVDPNNATSTIVFFEWGDDDAGAGTWDNTTASQSVSGDGDRTFSQAITGLVANTVYYFRAKFTSDLGAGSGTTLSFTTQVDPGAAAPKARSPRVIPFQAQYGVARTFYFSIDDPAGVDSDRFFNATNPFVAGDVKTAKVGEVTEAAFSNTSALPARVGGALYSLSLTAAELSAKEVAVLLVDQDGPAYRDLSLRIETAQRIGQIDVDGNAIGSSASAFRSKGSTGGYSFEGVAPSSTSLPRVKGFLDQMVQSVGIIQLGGPLGNHAATWEETYMSFVGGLLDFTGEWEDTTYSAGVGPVGYTSAWETDYSPPSGTSQGNHTARWEAEHAVPYLSGLMNFTASWEETVGSASYTSTWEAFVILDSSDAVATKDHYNGSVVVIVAGQGEGQSRVITDYSVDLGATINRLWSDPPPVKGSEYIVLPGQEYWDAVLAELTVIPSPSGTSAGKLQFLFQRFAFKHDRTAVTIQNYKANASTVYASTSVSYDGSTENIGKLVS